MNLIFFLFLSFPVYQKDFGITFPGLTTIFCIIKNEAEWWLLSTVINDLTIIIMLLQFLWHKIIVKAGNISSIYFDKLVNWKTKINEIWDSLISLWFSEQNLYIDRKIENYTSTHWGFSKLTNIQSVGTPQGFIMSTSLFFFDLFIISLGILQKNRVTTFVEDVALIIKGKSLIVQHKSLKVNRNSIRRSFCPNQHISNHSNT